MVTAFLAENAPFTPSPLPSWADPYREGSYVRTLPERDGCDGFFAAVLVRS